MNITQIFSNKLSIPVAVIVAGVLVAGAYLYINYSAGTLSPQTAAEKAIAYINDNIEEGAVASLVQVTAEKDIYKISLKVNETPYESYITKDGRFLFPSGIDLKQAAETTELLAKESPEESTAVASDVFAQCLTAKGMKFYGSRTCGWCAKEKELLGDSLQYITYIECLNDDGEWSQVCQDAGISSVPTWQLPDGTLQSGYKTLEQLAEISGCSL